MDKEFNLLEVLPAIQQPERLTAIESWHRHIPFAFALLDMLKPETFVELGTHRGDSYCSFCQGVQAQALTTRCFAVDTWQGDSQAGYYGDEVYQELSGWHDPRYGRFSTLLRMTFDEALERFADGSVDLLHIDGLHTYEAVRHDFESWLPKMSRRGVVLFHDTAVRHSHFAVWKLWAELAGQYPSFEFTHGFGLGVLAVGDQVPERVLAFLAHAQAHPREVNDFFHTLGDAAAVRKSAERIKALSAHLESVGEQLQHARHVVEERDSQLQELNAQRSELMAQQQNRQELQALAREFDFHRTAAELQRRELTAQCRALDTQLQMVLRSRVWRLRNSAMRLLGRDEAVIELGTLQYLPRPSAPDVRPAVDIIIPVYRNFERTRRSIESVLASDIRVPYELIVIDDCSPEPELSAWLDSQSNRFTLLRNETNQGFVRTVNRGMSLHLDRDVILLNSDAEVANDWLDRIQAAAYAGERIGSVTPFSNNATICSYPHFCYENEIPEGYDLARIDQLFARVNAGVAVDVPTGVGFCMYIRRACLDESGLFDAELFGRGYGEENEFCLRSAQHGWRHVLTGDTYVYHKGGASFGETQIENQRNGHRALLSVFPQYDLIIQQYIARDPAASMRFVVDMAISRESGLPVVLMISHMRGGGTDRHLNNLIRELEGQAVVYVLKPLAEGGLVTLGRDGDVQARLAFDPFADFERLVSTLQALGVSRIHFHHTIGLAQPVLTLPERLKCPYDVTIHDYYLACPQVSLTDAAGRYCGAPDEAGCNRCLAERPAPGGVDIAGWRRFGGILLAGAERVFVPSMDTGRRIERYFPGINLIHARHEPAYVPAPVQVHPLESDRPLKVLTLGALSIIKGGNLLEAVALEARKVRAPLDFHLLGFSYRPLRAKPFSSLEVHGEYQDAELPRLLKELQPDVVWFPGSCPETFSYTLSECLRAGLPVLAPNIGAFPERLAGREKSWLYEPGQEVEQMMQLLLDVRAALAGKADVVLPGEAVQPSFLYAQDYCVGGEIAVAVSAAVDWGHLHAQWAQLQQPVRPSGLEARHPLVGRAVSLVMRQGWLMPILAKVPYDVRQGIKRILLRR